MGRPSGRGRRRLTYLANNVRYLIFPGVRTKNLASRVLVKCLSSDWQRIHGHPRNKVETFVDPSRFAGTCDKAAGWIGLGETRGFGRNGGSYLPHGQKKTVWIRLLSKDARALLSGPDDTSSPPFSGALLMIFVPFRSSQGKDQRMSLPFCFGSAPPSGESDRD